HEGCKYAVYITKDVKGFSGGNGYGTVRSPFSFVNHTSQTEDLEEGLEVLKKQGVQREDIAFAWSFTTQTPMKFYQALRNGLRGEGTLSRLSTEFPAVLSEIHSTGIPFDADGAHPDFPYVESDNIITLQGKYFQVLIDFFAPFFGGQNVHYSFEDVDYIVFGKFESPDFRKATGDNVFDIDIATGDAEYTRRKIPFMITVPKTTEKRKPPFPVIMYAHGNATSRFEALLLAQAVARFGFATFAIDAVGHGPLLPLQLKEWLERELLGQSNDFGITSLDDLVELVALFVESYLIPPDEDLPPDMDFDTLLKFLRGDDKGEGGIGIFKEIAFWGRSEDENGDGIAENGEAFFVAQPFRQRDCIRQTMIDYLQMIRIIQSFDQAKVPPKVENAKNVDFGKLAPNALAGDFNADGVLDIGGKDNPVYMAGTSLGGIHTSLIGSIEPDIKAIAPLVAGGGLTDVFVRSKLRDRFVIAFLYNLGPLVIGCAGEGKVYLSFNNDTDDCDKALLEKASFGIGSFEAPATIILENLNNGETDSVTTDSAGNFSAAVASDKNDIILVRIFDKNGKEVPAGTFSPLNPEKFAFNPDDMTVTTPYEGVALKRNTPRFRRNVGFMQVIMDQVDPGVLLRYLTIEPPDGIAPRNILQTSVLKDMTVPISGQIQLARTVGNLGLTQDVWMPLNNVLIQKGVLWGSDYDVDDLDNNN
ncbi:MAG: hypothetical protein FJ088_08225, partial [Deltaproteobacteria bacterium]|nr:hypothetical protein [Deltaproteobacteria bacterium]